MLARWVYSQTDDTGHGLYTGLHYRSRLDKNWECWAIFNSRITIGVCDSVAITADDADLKKDRQPLESHNSLTAEAGLCLTCAAAGP